MVFLLSDGTGATIKISVQKSLGQFNDDDNDNDNRRVGVLGKITQEHLGTRAGTHKIEVSENIILKHEPFS